jgi:hypothetical protein
MIWLEVKLLLWVLVSVLLSQRVFSLSTGSVPEYLFSVSDTSETITSMETAPPNMALVCVPSVAVTNSQKSVSCLSRTFFKYS